ncbi:MAG: hypothetical protein AABW58_03540 [Nanoarchaeota archaeon]
MKKILIILLIIIVITAYIIKSNNDLNLSDSGDLAEFISLYSNWVYITYSNVRDVTGYAVKKEWIPKSSTNSTNSS